MEMINFFKTRTKLQWLAAGLLLIWMVILATIGALTVVEFAWYVALFCAAAFVGYMTT